MASNADFSMSPAELTEATKQLDALADRIEGLMHNEASNLTVVAAGRDEVSQRVASTLNDVHGGFTKSTDRGMIEIRETAAALRAHADHVVAADQDLAV
jgi:PE family